MVKLPDAGLRSFFVPRWSVRNSRRLCAASGVVLLVLLLAGLLPAQATPGGGPDVAVVTFALEFPASDPPHYSITVDATGHASYECVVKVEDTPDPQTYRTEFDVTAASRDHIFDWTRQANYFAGKIDSGKSKLAFTGAKTLSYTAGERSFTSEYNFSSLEPVRLLTALFQNMQSTLDFGRRLAYYHRYQKLALDDELKRMEVQAKNNQLSEIQAVAPVLHEIVEDASVINVVRARAKELIQMGSGASAGH